MTAVTIVGNLVDDPQLRFTSAGKAVANFTVAESKRVKDGNEWKDGPITWWKCSLWDSAAENLMESVKKGQRLIVVGEVVQREFETKAGEKRSVFEVNVSEAGPSMKWAIAKVEKTTKTAPKAKPAEDPWSSTPADNLDEAPF